MSGHTPRPWVVSAIPEDGELEIVADGQPAGRRWIASVGFPPATHHNGNDIEANARLIAAAPDLLRACRALERELRGLRPGLDRQHPHRGVMREKVDDALRIGRNAIAKATDSQLEPSEARNA